MKLKGEKENADRNIISAGMRVCDTNRRESLTERWYQPSRHRKFFVECSRLTRAKE
jgi:hypothetical protein